MPVQTQQNSQVAMRLGAKVAQAHAEHKDKPVDTGDRRLPSDIRGGVAKLSSLYINEYKDDKMGPGTKGQPFFRASAVVMLPVEHKGEKVAGMVTQQIISLCDLPAKNQRPAVPFTDNWYKFQNLFKLLGVAPPEERGTDEAAGQRIMAYYYAAMKMLVDPARPPVYVSFSTRGWTPPATALQPKPTEMVFETWHGLAEYNAEHDPAAGVTVGAPHANGPPPVAPPAGQSRRAPTTQVERVGAKDRTSVGVAEAAVTAVDNAAAARAPAVTAPATKWVDPDEVAALVEAALADPDGATEEGAEASARLEELAWAAGWDTEATAGAADWSAVGEMALTGPNSNGPPTADAPAPDSTPAVGSRWLFAKRTKAGAKLKNNRGEEFPPQEVEVVTVDPGTETCTVKSVKDGRVVTDIRNKEPVAVKFEWLEDALAY